MTAETEFLNRDSGSANSRNEIAYAAHKRPSVQSGVAALQIPQGVNQLGSGKIKRLYLIPILSKALDVLEMLEEQDAGMTLYCDWVLRIVHATLRP